MNYIELINAFERWLEFNYLPISSQLLWYKLIVLFNKSGWSEWVTVDNQRLMALMQMKREATFIECRDKLIVAGLFEFQKGKKGFPNRYKIKNTFKTVVQSEVETVVNGVVNQVVNSEVKTVVQTVDIYKQNKTKQNKTKKEKQVKGKSGLISSYTENEDLRQAIADFIEMRKSMKKPMSDKALSMLFSKLDSLSADDTTKIKILEQSIFNNWQGVFALKGESNDRSSRTLPGGSRASEKPKYDIKYTNELPLPEMPRPGDDIF